MRFALLAASVLIALSCPASAASLPDLDQMIEDGHCEQAASLLDPLVDISSPDPRALYLKARAELMIGNLEEAQEWGEKSVQAAPDSAEYWAQLGTIKAFRIRKSPMKGITLGRSSRKDYEKALKLDPRNLNALESMMMFRLYAPGIVGGDKDKARQFAEQILAVDPAQGHMARAHILRWADKDMDRAREEMRLAAEASPGDPRVCYELGRRLLAEGHTQDGLQYYRLGAGRDPDPVKGKLKLGEAYLKNGFSLNCEELALEVLAADPGNPEARVLRARSQLARNQVAEGIAALQEVLAASPDHLPTRYYLGKAYLDGSASYQEAADLLAGYLDGHLNLFWPSRAVANWQLALALEKLQRYDQAWQHMSLALELSSGNDSMKHDAKRLEFMAKD
jgi:tetratricopeptide (TPR) repeat protein